MRKDLTPGVMLLITLISSAIIYFNYNNKNKDILIDKMHKEYPIITRNQQINGRISKVDFGDTNVFRVSENFVCVKINDTISRRFFAINTDNRRVSLKDVLGVGDSLSKGYNSDRLFIYKFQNSDTLKYEFKLLDD
jgi:hypothetical protein